MRTLRCLLALCAALVCAARACPAWAADLKFTSIAAPPWADLADSGQPVGAFADIVGELRRRTGHAIDIALHPFARVERELENGEQDCAIMLWNEARANIAERGEVVYLMTFGVVGRVGVPLDDYDDLLPLTVSVVRNLRIDPRFDSDSRLRKDEDKDYASGLRKLERGRVEAVAGALPTILAQAERDGVAAALGKPLVLSVIPLALQCSRRSRHLGEMAGLDAALRAMRRDDTLPAILARYGYH